MRFYLNTLRNLAFALYHSMVGTPRGYKWATFRALCRHEWLHIKFRRQFLKVGMDLGLMRKFSTFEPTDLRHYDGEY